MASSISAQGLPFLPSGGSPVLPRLREDVRLLPGPRSADGTRSWLIHDPVRNAFFRIGWREFQILSHWKGTAEEVVARVTDRDAGLGVEIEDVETVSRFMADNELTVLGGGQDRETWLGRLDALRNKPLSRLFQENLFLRVPLVDPDRFLSATMPIASIFFSRGFWRLTFLAAAIGMFLAGRQWDSFAATFSYFFSVEGILIYALALTFAKVIHELGHAYAAKRHGLRVPSMGVAFLVFWPVLFTDTTDSWRLRSGRDRFIVAGAGMAAEIALAAWALLLWSLVPTGPVQSALFALATATWLITIVININPLIRFDGYFLLSDALEVENLQPRAYALLRHLTYRRCLGLTSADPEPALSAALRRGMVVYAIGALIYRVVLALGIGVLLYYMAFKLLGIVALAAVVWVMLLQPVGREAGRLLRSGEALAHPLRLFFSIGFLAGVCVVLAYPWPSVVSAPAVLRAEKQVRLFAPYPARVATLSGQPGDSARAGEIMMSLDAPEIRSRLRTAEARAETFRQLIDRIAFRDDIADQESIARQQLAQALAEIEGYRKQLSALDLRAPFDGILVWVADGIHPGAWVRPERPIALFTADDAGLLTSYVEEGDLARIDTGVVGRFYPYGKTEPPKPVKTISIAPAATAALSDIALSSVHGGPIPARAADNGEILPERSVYETRLTLIGNVQPPAREIIGIVKLNARPESLARRAWRQVRSVVARESGF